MARRAGLLRNRLNERTLLSWAQTNESFRTTDSSELRSGLMRIFAVRGQIRVPTVIVAVNYAKVPKKRPKLCAKAIRERDGNRCQYTGRLLHPNEGSLDHVVPRSRGGKDAWENLVWSAKEVNQRKADRLPREAGLR